jgi:hypothetical protein
MKILTISFSISIFIIFPSLAETKVPLGKVVTFESQDVIKPLSWVDEAKNVYVRAKKEMFVFDRKGAFLRKVPIKHFYTRVLKDGSYIGLEYKNIHFMDKEGNVRHTTELPVFHKEIAELRNGDIALGTIRGESVNCKIEGVNNCKPGADKTTFGGLMRLSRDGKILASIESGDYSDHHIEHSDGTISYQDFFRVFFVGTDWKIRSTFVRAEPMHMKSLFGTLDGHLVISHTNKLMFVDMNGIKKGEFVLKETNSRFVGATLLPGNLILANASDGYSYFLNTKGEVKYTHHHDSDFVSAPLYVGKGLSAYWNKTELVFLDLQGNEKGTIPLERKRLSPHSEISSSLTFIQDGLFMVRDPSGLRLYFVQF